MVAVTNLRDLLSEEQEDLIKAYLNLYSCTTEKDMGIQTSLNPDIEHFLKHDAIQFARMKIAVTYLVSDTDDGALLGYFTLAHKALEIPADGLSRKMKDKIRRFSSLDGGNYMVSAFLLAQFGKNFAVDKGSRITGHNLMRIAVEKLLEAQNTVGGTIVYLDCEANAKLIRFYESESFNLFGERISKSDGKRYLQYLTFV